jgi:hypothetical protein
MIKIERFDANIDVEEKHKDIEKKIDTFKTDKHILDAQILNVSFMNQYTAYLVYINDD